jgi:hypothetical protein
MIREHHCGEWRRADARHLDNRQSVERPRHGAVMR